MFLNKWKPISCQIYWKMTQLTLTHMRGMWLSQLLSDCWLKRSGFQVCSFYCSSPIRDGSTSSRLSGPIVSSVRQAGRIAAQAGLSLSADQKLPDQLCDDMTANHDSAEHRHRGHARAWSGFRRRCLPSQRNIWLLFCHCGTVSRSYCIFSGIAAALRFSALPVMWHDAGL